MSAELWASIERMADVWLESDVVRRYRGLVADTSPGTIGLLINNESVQLGGIPHAQPLLYAMFLQAEKFPSLAGHPDAKVFYEVGPRVAGAFLRTLEWLRSRFPGYPMFRVPHLVRGALLVNRGLQSHVPWLFREISGLQLLSSPPDIAIELGLTEGIISAAARSVANALTACPQLRALSQRRTSLKSADLKALELASDTARQRLRSEAIRNEVDDTLFAVLNYRSAVVEDVVNSLPDDSQRFVLAFEEANLVLEEAAALFSQSIVYGPALRLTSILRAQRRPGTKSFARASVADWRATSIHLMRIVRFDSELFRNAMCVHGMHVQVARRSRSGQSVEVTLSGPVLSDSTDVRCQ